MSSENNDINQIVKSVASAAAELNNNLPETHQNNIASNVNGGSFAIGNSGIVEVQCNIVDPGVTNVQVGMYSPNPMVHRNVTVNGYGSENQARNREGWIFPTPRQIDSFTFPTVMPTVGTTGTVRHIDGSRSELIPQTTRCNDLREQRQR
jgi:hypothetical protein